MIRKNRIFMLERLIRKKIVLVVVLLSTALCTEGVFAETDSPVKELDQDYKFSISTTWHSFLNIEPEETNIQMYEFHFGYKLTEKDKIKIKVATWKLFEPLGIQMWDPHILKESEYYPGRLLEYGIGIKKAFFSIMDSTAACERATPVKRILSLSVQKWGLNIFSSNSHISLGSLLCTTTLSYFSSKWDNAILFKTLLASFAIGLPLLKYDV